MFGSSHNNSFKVSKPLFAILLTTILLAVLLAVGTVRNLQREQQFMKSFLRDEGLTLIRSFEAGARTTMRHPMMMKDSQPLITLVEETAKSQRIAYIAIVTEDGTVVASVGNHDITEDHALTHKVLETRKPVDVMVADRGTEPVFEVVTTFQALSACQSAYGINGMKGIKGMQGRHHCKQKTPQTIQLEEGRAVIHLGLYTGEFVKASRQDLMHSLFMGGLLLLVGSAGFYFLFLYQGMQVTRATLASMKLYTQNIIESMPDGLLTLDSKGKIVSCNPQILKLSEMDFTSLHGRKPEELFAGWSADSCNIHKGSAAFAYIFKHSDGSQVPVEISSSPLLDDQGRSQGAVFLLRDMTTIRSMQEQLARSRRLAALGKMAAGIAHEIRNPLGTLRGFAHYFGSKADDEASREYSTLMIGEVDRLNESISALLQFSRPRLPEFTSLNPEDILDKSVKLLEYDFKEKDIILKSNFTCTEFIEADQDLLLQVMLNLLKNAINASKPEDTVTLSCTQSKKNIHITVTDDGSGMNEVEKGRMFDPFFTTKPSGTGLGLAVSHQIIEQHNGRFEVISGPELGTTVTVILPQRQTIPQKES